MNRSICLLAGCIALASCTGAVDPEARGADVVSPGARRGASAESGLTIAQGSFTLWPATATPVIVDAGRDRAVELGVKFRADVAGHVTGIRFYKAPDNSGTHVGNLWTSSGTRLASATFTNETASGWQQVEFATPVPIAAGSVYVASYHCPNGHYADDTSYFAGAGLDSPPLHALADGASGHNGVYTYGSTSRFPLRGWRSSNYWVDVVFSPTVASDDSTPPVVTAFTIPDTATTLTVPILGFTATDDTGVTGYLIGESATAPSPATAGWSPAPPSSYTFASAGTKTLHAWARDAAGNVSASASASVTVTLAPADSTPPVVTAFTIPATATALTVPILGFTATDDTGVTGYLIGESATAPSPATAAWSPTAPSSYTFASAGTKTLHAWARDAAGNVSASASASVTVTLAPSSGPEPAGWYAGDMHVHRSCGGSPVSVSSLQQMMGAENLAAISLLADMGNGEVQDATQDLPRVTGQDDPTSTPGRIVHWDAEWHWDPTYWQYPHQALGGHVVALGVSEAHPIWEEYTAPIFDWAHRAGGIAGFAHMQYLDGGIPQSLDCCTPLEYPVEVALGSSDFISEDVADANSSWSGMDPESAVRAYYRLLNCGFRPGLAAGTDHPCNAGRDLGSLLTYVQVADGQLTYRGWIDGIARGRTVVSRNGHDEFLSLVVNDVATPGDEVRLTGAGTVTATVQWTATRSLSGRIELVSNGVVVSSTQASAAPGAPATLGAAIEFPKSGWLAARRMGSTGHAVHTAAVFVVVDGAPVRASAMDASFYVQWIDNLLARTSPGGEWSSFLVNDRSAAQARYRAAKALYEQIAAEAGGGGVTPAEGTIFTSQTPTLYENDAAYELGTRFWADVAGRITHVRLFTSAMEGGSHTVRLWRAGDAALVAGPYTWSLSSGVEGWRTFALPSPVSISANTDYVVVVSNSSDRYYSEQPHGLDAAIANGHLHTYPGSGVWTESLGTMPTSTWQNTNYFRDVVFAPEL